VRATLPLTLAISLAAHALLAGGVALSCYRWSSQETVAPVETLVTLTMIRPDPVRPSTAGATTKDAKFHAVAMSAPATPATFSPAKAAVSIPAPDKGLPVLAKTTPAPEANPNAHLPSVPPEAALAPVPAPQLDGTKGMVFILDISGSMYEPYAGSTRLSYAREALGRRVRALPEGTPFALVLYAQKACASGPLVAANNATREAAVRFLMRDVDCGGGTNLPAGLAAARALHTGALVLASDGDLNISGPELMLSARTILGENGEAPAIEVVGIGPRPGTTADRLLQDIADLAGGSYTVERTPEETALLGPAKADAAR